jgi:RNA polymerase-binding transcription factor DksA
MDLSEAQIADLGRRLRILRGELETQLRVTGAADHARGPRVTRVDLQLREVEQRRRLQLVLEALRRLENEAYGLCQACSAGIDYEYLQTQPEARFCTSCAAHGVLPAAHTSG